MRKPWPVILLVFGLMLGTAACGGEDEPTPAATPSPAPTETESGSRLPPTWTPIPEGFVATDAPTADTPGETMPTATPVNGGQQLPPTWTPLPDDFAPPRTTTPLQPLATREVVPTIGGTPIPNPPTWTPYPAECEQFDVLTSPERVILGNPAGIGWSPLPGAAGYEVLVRHRGGGILIDEVTTSTLFEIPAETFFEQGAYGWEVIPLNRDGEQLCASRGDELYVYRLN